MLSQSTIKSLVLFSRFFCMIVISSVLSLLTFNTISEAQSYRYMDDAGNIHWVDSIKEVPSRYRSQVVVPTPFAGIDTRGKTYKQALAEFNKAEKERKAEEAKKKKEEEKANKRAALEAKRKAYQEEKQRKLDERLKSRSKLDKKSGPVMAPPVNLPPGSGPSYGKIKSKDSE